MLAVCARTCVRSTVRITPAIEAPVESTTHLLARPRFAVPAPDAHKYTRGLVLVVGGAMAGVLFQRLTGVILATNGGKYGIIFLICGLVYLGAWAVFHGLVPKMARVE